MLLVCTDGLIETGGHDLDTGWQRLIDVLWTTVPPTIWRRWPTR